MPVSSSCLFLSLSVKTDKVKGKHKHESACDCLLSAFVVAVLPQNHSEPLKDLCYVTLADSLSVSLLYPKFRSFASCNVLFYHCHH